MAGKKNEPKSPKSAKAAKQNPLSEAAEAEDKGLPEECCGPLYIFVGVLVIVFCTQMYKLCSNFLALHKTLNPRKYDVSPDFGLGDL